jgi:hypothetical protein
MASPSVVARAPPIATRTTSHDLKQLDGHAPIAGHRADHRKRPGNVVCDPAIDGEHGLPA